MKKMKLKKKVKRLFILCIILIIGLVIGYNKYKEYQYKKTNEYKLTVVGYTLDESKIIIDKLNNENENYFINNTKIEYIIDLINEKYFLEKNLHEYIDYKNNNKSKELNEVVALVNVGANKDWYDVKKVKPTDLSKGDLILVNKFNYLTKDYVPEEITSISLSYAYSDNKVSKRCNDAYIEMAKAAKEDGIKLMANSTYRTYERQEKVYKDYYYSKGISYADKYAARAGYSEHQTGLAIDIFTPSHPTTSTFENSDAFVWLTNNAHKFGFILRYPKGKEHLTGYAYESWHYRYLGKDIATKVYESGLTYDEYYAYYLEN
ncbi:MAG: M15 family metallopeptidase [Bacilli bacterium]|nr:M15 family metallopeptidase [Bacilli bacterium]